MPQARSLLVEWWSVRSAHGEHTGRWYEAEAPDVARAHALAIVAEAWTARVRISILHDGQPAAVVDADAPALVAWDVLVDPLPAHIDGPPLPPRSPDDVRREVVCGCRDALALGLRSGLLQRRRVAVILHEIDRSFDPGMLDDLN